MFSVFLTICNKAPTEKCNKAHDCEQEECVIHPLRSEVHVIGYCNVIENEKSLVS